MTEVPPDKAAQLKALRARLARLGAGAGQKISGAVLSPTELRRLVLKQRHEAPPSRGPAEPILYRRDLPRQVLRRGAGRASSGPKVVLEQAVTGAEQIHPLGGPAVVVSTPVVELAGAEALSDTFDRMLTSVGSRISRRLAAVCGETDLSPSDLIFMDIETTGLTSSPLFLIGVMLWGTRGFEVHQYFARHYAEERGVLAMFLEACSPRKVLVTFNGKSFDYPYVRARCAATGLPFGLDPAHLDLLHESRRVWRKSLPNCRLQTLERSICRRARSGDIPSSEIPEAYHAYVRSADAREMVEVLKHNMLDLVTLADLMTRFPEPEDESSDGSSAGPVVCS